MRQVSKQHVSYLVRSVILRNFTSRSSRATSSAAADIKDTQPKDKDVFGTLSRSGSRNLQVQLAEKVIPDDPDGYDKVEFDIKARKNFYYYKYEIPKYACQGAIGLKKALELFREMKVEARIEPDTNSFTPLIFGCAKAGYTKRAFDLYEESLRYKSKPTKAMVTCLINACAECPFPEYGLQRLEWFRTHVKAEYNWQFNEMQYNSAIKAYGKLGRLDEASKLVQEMLDNNVMPTIDTFNMLLIGCASDEKSGCALGLRVFKRLKMYDFKPTVVTYRLLLRCIRQCGMGSAELLEETLKELPAVTSPKQRIEYSRQAQRSQRSDRKSDLRAGFEWMPLLTDLGRSIDIAIQGPARVSPTALQRSVVNDQSRKSHRGFAQKEQSQAEMISLDGSQEPGIVPSSLYSQATLPNLLSDDHLDLMTRIKSIRFDGLISASDRIMLFGGISGYLDAMIQDDCKPDAKTFSMLLPSVLPYRQSYLEYHELAVEMKIKRDLSYYDQLVRFVCDHGRMKSRIDLALHFVEQMQLDDIRPNISTYQALAGACDSWPRAKRLMDDLIESGYAVSPMIIAKFLKRAAKNSNFYYLNRIIDHCSSVNWQPKKYQLEELENLRINTNNLILKHEKGEKVDSVEIDEKFISQFDIFRMKLRSWMKSVEIEDEPHPWEQFNVDRSSGRDGYKAYTEYFKTVEQLKEDALKRGDKNFGNLAQKAKKKLASQSDSNGRDIDKNRVQSMQRL